MVWGAQSVDNTGVCMYGLPKQSTGLGIMGHAPPCTCQPTRSQRSARARVCAEVVRR